MGEARDVLDRLTAALTSGDLKAAEALYAENTVVMTPEQGEITGRESVIEYWRVFMDAFSDLHYEPVAAHESGNVAIDEGYYGGTHTGSLRLPSGESIPATGRQVRVRSCDAAVVEGGMITAHRLYSDQLEFLEQLGMAPQAPS